MGSAEARWGWRVVDGAGVGTVSASDLGPAYSSLVLPFPTTLGIRLRIRRMAVATAIRPLRLETRHRLFAAL